MSANKPDCPCGSGALYAHCCGPAHQGQAARSAEALMRSRYSAFALELGDYLLATWHASTRPPSIEFSAPAPRWIGLRVLATEACGECAAEVEFLARYRIGGRAGKLHERSRFVLEEGRWYYVDGCFPSAGTLPKS